MPRFLLNWKKMQKGNSTALCLWCTLLPECADVHIQQHINRKYLNRCLPLYYYAKVLVELKKKKKYKKWIQLRYAYAYQTNLLLKNFLKVSLKSFESFWFYIWVLVIWLFFVRQMVLSHLLPLMLMNKKTCVQRPPNVF